MATFDFVFKKLKIYLFDALIPEISVDSKIEF